MKIVLRARPVVFDALAAPDRAIDLPATASARW